MATVYSPSGKAFEEPIRFPNNRGMQRAFIRGFDSYVWFPPAAGANHDIVCGMRARNNYQRATLIVCFREGWAAAAALDKAVK